MILHRDPDLQKYMTAPLPWAIPMLQSKYRTWARLEAFRAIEAVLVKHDNNMKDYSLVADWSP